MTPCPQHNEVRTMLDLGHWPAACPPSLRSHIESCRHCSQQVLLTSTFQFARAESLTAPRIDPPYLLWWRAQLRRRNAALEKVSRPIATAHLFALVITLAAAAFGILQLLKSIDWTSPSPATPDPATPATTSLLTSLEANPSLLFVFAGLTTLILLGALALYLTSEGNQQE